MKRKLFLGLAAVALVFASCSNDEEVLNNGKGNPASIGFEVSTGKTRATTFDLAALQASNNGFGVYATNGNPSAQFIDNEGYHYDGGQWKWVSTDQNWPTLETGYPINFYAYYPKSTPNSVLTTALTRAYTVASTPEQQTDFLAARQAGVVSRPSSGKVAFDFKHILSKVDFKVVTGASVTVEVQSIAVKNVGGTATFNFGTMLWSVVPSTFNQSYSYMKAPVVNANKFTSKTTPFDVTGSSGSLMLMPQDLTSRAWAATSAPTTANSYIEVVYRVLENAAPNKDVVGYTDPSQHPDYATMQGSKPTTPLFVKVGYSLPTNWQMGKAYTYTVSLGTPDATGGTLLSANFLDGNGADSGLNVRYPDTGEIIPEGPINQDKPIGFTVTVADWGTPTNGNLN